MKAKILFISILLITANVVRADDLSDRMRACNAIESDAERLACFDGLLTSKAPVAPVEPVEPVVPVESVTPVEAVVPAAAAPAASPEPAADVAAPPPATESLGAETLRHKEREAEDKEEVRATATVTRCGESAEGRYLFYFSNGQVWKQSKQERLHFRDCNFDVTITKDFFGYKMQQVGEKRRIRIRRLK